MVIPAGRRIGLMVLARDREYTVRPAPGTQLTLDLAGSSFTLPIVGGAKALATATGGDLEDGTVGGTVPATLALTLGAPARVRRVHAGRRARSTSATTTATVVSTAGDATLTVADPATTNTGKLVNGAFALPQPLQVHARELGAFAPVGGSAAPDDAADLLRAGLQRRVDDRVQAVDRRQRAAAHGDLRKTLTFTLSTTTP